MIIILSFLYITTTEFFVNFDSWFRKSNVGINKLLHMVNLYFGSNLPHVSHIHERTIEQLKYEIKKWKCYAILGEIEVFTDGDFLSVLCQNKQKYGSFVQKAQVLIVDTTHTLSLNQKCKNFLKENNILLVECRKTKMPRSCTDLNQSETIEYVALEYIDSIMEVRSHILTKICLHDANLNLIKK